MDDYACVGPNVALTNRLEIGKLFGIVMGVSKEPPKFNLDCEKPEVPKKRKVEEKVPYKQEPKRKVTIICYVLNRQVWETKEMLIIVFHCPDYRLR